MFCSFERVNVHYILSLSAKNYSHILHLPEKPWESTLWIKGVQHINILSVYGNPNGGQVLTVISKAFTSKVSLFAPT